MTVPRTQLRVVQARVPTGVPTVHDFRLESCTVPEIADGEVLVRVIDLSLDPYLRSVIAGRHLGHNAPGIGGLMPGRSTAQVMLSRTASLPEGAIVVAETGWQQYAAVDAGRARVVDSDGVPLSAALGVLGMPGLTAWAGVTQLLSIRAGDTFVVSAAIGGVGSTAGQLARYRGARVVGIAGGPEKCRIAVDHFGFDACIDYREADWERLLADATPNSVTAYFDNTGGVILEGVLRRLTVGGHIVLCGLIDQYNTGVPYALPLAPVIGKRAHLHGLVVYDFESRFDAFHAEVAPLVRDGTIRLLEDRSVGLSRAPEAFQQLMSGRNIGKSIVAVSAP